MGKKAAAHALGYRERVHAQTLAWAEGRPYHNHIDCECCPDFSCCQPELFENNEEERWSHYRDLHAPKEH